MVSVGAAGLMTGWNTASDADAVDGRNKEKRIFVAVMWNGLVTLLSWVPGTIFFILLSFKPKLFSVMVYTIVVALEWVSCAVNPVVYHGALPDIGRAMNNSLPWRKGRTAHRPGPVHCRSTKPSQ